MARRFFVQDTQIFDDQIVIDGSEHVHISKVLRMKKGEKIDVSSENFEFECEIFDVQKQKTVCKILQKKQIENNLPPLTLFQAIMKNEHMDFLVQKCTEIGVKSLVPFLSEFVVVRPDDKKIDRLNRISIEACKQSGRSFPMQILKIQTFDDVLEKLCGFDQVLVAFEKDLTPAKSVLMSLDKTKTTAIVVGSEGGFSENEIKKLKQVGAKTFGLGKNILRGETAAIVASSLVLFVFDHFS